MIKLNNPYPRDYEKSNSEFPYVILDTIYLTIPEKFPQISFFEVIERRRSNRLFAMINIEKLSDLLWLTLRTRERKREESGYIWQHKNVPSAGGRHPIDILITGLNYDYKNYWKYNSISHSISRLAINIEKNQELLQIVDQIIPYKNSLIIWQVCQYGKVNSKYENCESLIWRDAGVILANLYLTAEYLGLSCCALGITGDPWLSDILNGQNALIGTGGCLLGERS
jgi:SagB-type dehydrogenase family enzyme